MRFAAACFVFAASVVPVLGAYSTPKLPPEPPSADHPTPIRRAPLATRFLSFRSAAIEVDNQVIANLLADMPRRTNEIALMVMAGEIARCESRACQVPLTIHIEDAQGPVALSFAAASPKGEITDVQHAECNASDCAVSLILERGHNTVSVGVLDALAHATGYATIRVNATRNVADRGRAEWF